MKCSRTKYTVATHIYSYFKTSLNLYIAKIDIKIDPTYPLYLVFYIAWYYFSLAEGAKKKVGKVISVSGRGGP
jgi:hypothetical protein